VEIALRCVYLRSISDETADTIERLRAVNRAERL